MLGSALACAISSSSASGRKLLWLIPVAAAAFALLSVTSKASAYPGLATSGLQAAAIQETDYDWPTWEGSQGYTDHLDTYFRLYVREEEGRLRVHLPDIPEVALRTISGYGNVYPVNFKKSNTILSRIPTTVPWIFSTTTTTTF